MKITVDSLMAGEHLPYRIGDVSVKLDGNIIDHATAADDVQGWVAHHKKDENGFLIPEEWDQYTPKTFFSYGYVEFVFAEVGENDERV